MQQTKKQSLFESFTNVLVGYGIHLPLHQNMLIGFWFTLISITRSYLLRRWFTGKVRFIRWQGR